MMRINWASTITAGIFASIAVIFLTMLVPRLVGMEPIDLTWNIGSNLSIQSPHVAGTLFLSLMGILWAAIFSVVYNILPGNTLMKGTIFGLVVGGFSLAVLPNILPTMSQLLGVVNQNAAVNALSMNVTTLITLVAYVMFGIIIAKSHAPLVNSSNEI